MALYANENGTLQQLSDKSSGSNPYAQLEVVYSRNFIDNPLKFDSSMLNIKHTILTNKPIGEYHLLLAVNSYYSSSSSDSFSTPTLRHISIPGCYKNNKSQMGLELENYCGMLWILPSDKSSNNLKYMYTSNYPSGGYSVSSHVWDFYLI